MYEQTSANAAPWAAPTFLPLGPFRIAFAPAVGLLHRGIGRAALAPLDGWVRHKIVLVTAVERGVGAAMDVTRGAEASVSTAAPGVSDASPPEEDAAAVHTATTADTQVPGDDADDVVDFAHGTTRASATDIIANGLSYEAGLRNLAGSVEPGSFFTIRIDLSDPSEALSTAAFWAKRNTV